MKPVRTMQIVIALGFFVIGCIVYDGMSAGYDRQIELIRERQDMRLQTEYKAVLEGLYRQADMWFSLSIELPDVFHEMAVAKDADPDSDAFRAAHESLFHMLQGPYRTMMQRGVKQLHFHSPENISVLRMHRPEQYGDDLSDIRSTVAAANRQQQITRGFEEGRIFNGFRNVYPLILDEMHIGSVEISYSAAHVINEMNRVFAGTKIFIISREIVESTVLQHEQDNYVPSTVSDQFCEELNAYSDLASVEHELSFPEIAQINSRLDPLFLQSLVDFTPVPAIIHIDDAVFIVAALPLRNFTGESVAYIVSYERADSIRNLERIFRRNLLLMTTGAFGIFVLLIVVLEQRENTRSQNTTLEKLANARSQLVRETLHRTKNNMHMIMSLLNLQQNRVTDPVIQGLFQETQHRVYALSKIQEFLYRSDDLATIHLDRYIPDVISMIINAYSLLHGVVQYEQHVEPVCVPAGKAIQTGLVINELVTDMMKYAFPEGRSGTIFLDMQSVAAKSPGSESMVRLRLSDDGVGIPEEIDPFTNGGFGLQLVLGIVTDELKGTIELDREHGTAWTLTFPGVTPSHDR